MKKAAIALALLAMFAIIIPKVFADGNYVTGFISEVEGKNQFTIIESDLEEVHQITFTQKTDFYDETGNGIEKEITIGKMVKVWSKGNQMIATKGDGALKATKVQYVKAKEIDVLPRFLSKEKNKYNIYVFYDTKDFPTEAFFEEIDSSFLPFIGKGKANLVSYVSYLPTDENYKEIFDFKKYPSILIFDDTQVVYKTTELLKAIKWLELK